MKNLILFFIIFFTAPAFALCPIDGDKVCSVSGYDRPSTPLFRQTQNDGMNFHSPDTDLQPMNRENPLNQMRSSNQNMNYSSACQFGNCLDNTNRNSLFNSDEGN